MLLRDLDVMNYFQVEEKQETEATSGNGNPLSKNIGNICCTFVFTLWEAGRLNG